MDESQKHYIEQKHYTEQMKSEIEERMIIFIGNHRNGKTNLC